MIEHIFVHQKIIDGKIWNLFRD